MTRRIIDLNPKEVEVHDDKWLARQYLKFALGQNPSEIVFFEMNNWRKGQDYPDTEPFVTWFNDDLNVFFENDIWVRDNKLVVVETFEDIAKNFCVTAKRDWVEQTCPDLLIKQSRFLRFPKEDGKLPESTSPFGFFMKYDYMNIGLHYCESNDDFVNDIDKELFDMSKV